MKLPKKIPTFIGLILVFFIVGAVVMFTEGAIRMPSRASESQQPKEVQFSNITDTSFTVSWETSTPVTGTVSIEGSGKNNRVYYDTRDSSGNMGKYVTHNVLVSGGQSNTEYTVRILSGGKPHSELFKTRTGAALPANTTTMEPAYGTILDAQGLPVDGALVYLTVDGGQQLSSVTKSSGIWLIPLNQVRSQDLSGFLSPSDRTTETIFVRYKDGEIRATTDPLNDSPVPDMTVGQTYNFKGQQVNKTTGKEVALQPTPAVGGTETVLGQTTTPKMYRVSLFAPAEGASIPTTLPLISGTGIPDTFIGISIGITSPQNGSTKVKKDGTWSYTPAKHLAPGKQSVTITASDEKGKTVAITHSFQILKSGTQVLGDATPSATLTTTVTITATATPSEVITDTPEESTFSGEPIPETGSTLPTIILLVLGLSLLASGTVLFKP